ncbi:MAG: hypothetical protein ACOCQ4_00040 [bacterium]
MINNIKPYLILFFFLGLYSSDQAYSQDNKQLAESYQNLVEEAKNAYKEAPENEWDNYEKKFEDLNLLYEANETELTEREKSDIDRQKGQFRGYQSLREYRKIKGDVKDKSESLLNEAEGFYAAFRYDDIDCDLMYRMIDVKFLIINYAEMVEQVKDNFLDFDKNDWKTYKKMYDCINYELYKRKNKLTENQKDKCRKLKAQYLSCYYEWKGRNFMDDINDELKKWQENLNE